LPMTPRRMSVNSRDGLSSSLPCMVRVVISTREFWWDEPEWSCHTGFSANDVAELLRPKFGQGKA